MDKTSTNRNKELYSEHMIDSTIYRKNVSPAEKSVLKKYLTDTDKKVVEAGAGGGRLTFYIEEFGFKDVTGFDIVEEMMDYAQKEAVRRASNIRFIAADASDLKMFEDETFDYLVYAQQVLCFVPKELFQKSLEEAYRIASPGSLTIFTFLDFDSKSYNPLLSICANFLRKLRGEEVSKYHLPWLKLNNTQFNWKLLNKDQPSIYWVKKADIIHQLTAIGYTIIEANKGSEIVENGSKGVLYVICKK